MNPTELRMMWMSQYTPDRISLEDAATFFGHPSVGLSVMDDMSHQQTMDLNPMMSINDFNGQAAAAAAAAVAASSAAVSAALGVQPTTLITTSPNDIYGLAQVGGLHQQLLQQSAAAVFQSYNEIIDEDGVGALDNSSAPSQYITGDQQHQQVYDQMDDEDGGYDESNGALTGLTPKQEIINIDDFVMMTDSNSYDDTDFISTEKDASQDAINIAHAHGIDDHELLQPYGVQQAHKLMMGGNDTPALRVNTPATSSHTTGYRSQRKTRKIEPVNRPGLVLKTPIAYRGNIDPSVIPIQKDGMAVCERCGAIGVKHTFYTKSRRFCSMSCARGELYSLVVNNTKMSGGNQMQQQQQQQQQQQITSANNQTNDDQTKITHINGYENTRTVKINNTEMTTDTTELDDSDGDCEDGNTEPSVSLTSSQTPKALPPCPQMEKIISIRRRMYDPSHSYDWAPRLSRPNFFAASVTSFPHAPGYEVWDNIGVDMKVEVENTDCDNLEVIQPGQTPHSFWVATILNISGYKALMRYEGFDDPSHDFWVNLCNAEVHSVGWCATRGKPLIPPRTIENKFKDWKDFLVERLSGARTLPSSFYNKINDSMQSRFRLGLNLECVDKNRISQVRLATVTKIVGKRLFLRYFDSEDGFWCHEDSPIIHPVGWATTVGHNLSAPQDYLERMLAGREAMIEVHEDDATIELFKMNFTFEEYYMNGKKNGFIQGMKLEAVDPLNLSSICAATVMSVLKFGYMMIRIDSYQPDAHGYDWFCYHEKSPSIFPVGFCASNNITLTPPNGYTTNKFDWESYIQEKGSVTADQQLFHRIIPDHGFEVGMSLECADLMDPRLVCVATVSRVVGRLLKIHFDGWTDEYDQWLDCESPDVYPVGWCLLVNHKLEGPPAIPMLTANKTTPKTKSQKKRKKKAITAAAAITQKSNENTNSVKPRTIALKTNPLLPKLSIKLELKPEHHNSAFYEDNNDPAADEDDDDGGEEYDEDSISHRSDQSTPLPAAAAAATVATAERTSTPNTASAVVPTTQTRTAITTVKKSISPAPPTVGRKANSYIGNSSVSNSKYIPRLVDANESSNNELQADLQPDTWNVYDVSQFLRVNDCTAHCDTFSRNKIDGKRLLQLSKDDIITLLGMKVGPALKISDLIQQLKCKLNPSKSRMHKTHKSFL